MMDVNGKVAVIATMRAGRAAELTKAAATA
jgi:hypothetical protein